MQCKVYFCLQSIQILLPDTHTDFQRFLTHGLRSGNAVSPTLPSLSHLWRWHVSDLCRPGWTKLSSAGNTMSVLRHLHTNQIGLRLVDQNAWICLGAMETIQLLHSVCCLCLLRLNVAGQTRSFCGPDLASGLPAREPLTPQLRPHSVPYLWCFALSSKSRVYVYREGPVLSITWAKSRWELQR